MTSRRRRLAVGGLLALATAVVPAGTAAAQDLPPVPPVDGLQVQQEGGTQSMTVPGGELVQGPDGQTFVPDGFQLVQGADGQAVVPR